MKPDMIISYNKAKIGIDLSDQMSSYFTCLRKSIRWYVKVAIEVLLGTSIVNACVNLNELRSLQGKEKIQISEFRLSVATSLLELEDQIPSHHSKSRIQHFLRPNEKRSANGRRVRQFCLNCYRKNLEEHDRTYAQNKTRKVNTICSGCEDNNFFLPTVFRGVSLEICIF